MRCRFRVIVPLLCVLAAVACGPAFASREELAAALDAARALDPSVVAEVHPADFRTLDDRIAARELRRSDAIGELVDGMARELRATAEAALTAGALRVDAAQGGFAELHRAFLRCLGRFGIAPGSVRLYVFGELELEACSWGTPGPGGEGVVALSGRIVRMHLDGAGGRRLSDAELEFLISRELAHLSAGHGAYRLITLVARSVEDRLDDAARGLLRGLYRTVGLGGLALNVAAELTKPLQKWLVSKAFARFRMWDVNAAVGAARGALLAGRTSASRPARGAVPADGAREAAVRMLLLAMLGDLALVDRVDLAGFLAQVAHETPESLVRSPDAPANAGSRFRIAELVRRLLGIHHAPGMPVPSVGHAELVGDLVGWAAGADRRDLDRAGSGDPFEAALLAVRRMTDLDQLAAPGLLPEDGSDPPRVFDGLVRGMDAHLRADLAAHGGDLDAARLGRLIEELPGFSFGHHAAAHRVLESLGSAPPAGAEAAVDAALAASRLDALLRAGGHRAELARWLDEVDAPRSVRNACLPLLDARIAALKGLLATQLARADRAPGAASWLRERATTVADSRTDAWNDLVEEVADELEKTGRASLAPGVRATAIAGAADWTDRRPQRRAALPRGLARAPGSPNIPVKRSQDSAAPRRIPASSPSRAVRK